MRAVAVEAGRVTRRWFIRDHAKLREPTVAAAASPSTKPYRTPAGILALGEFGGAKAPPANSGNAAKEKPWRPPGPVDSDGHRGDGVGDMLEYRAHRLSQWREVEYSDGGYEQNQQSVFDHDRTGVVSEDPRNGVTSHGNLLFQKPLKNLQKYKCEFM